MGDNDQCIERRQFDLVDDGKIYGVTTVFNKKNSQQANDESREYEYQRFFAGEYGMHLHGKAKIVISGFWRTIFDEWTSSHLYSACGKSVCFQLMCLLLCSKAFI